MDTLPGSGRRHQLLLLLMVLPLLLLLLLLPYALGAKSSLQQRRPAAGSPARGWWRAGAGGAVLRVAAVVVSRRRPFGAIWLCVVLGASISRWICFFRVERGVESISKKANAQSRAHQRARSRFRLLQQQLPGWFRFVVSNQRPPPAPTVIQTKAKRQGLWIGLGQRTCPPGRGGPHPPKKRLLISPCCYCRHTCAHTLLPTERVVGLHPFSSICASGPWGVPRAIWPTDLWHDALQLRTT